MIKFPIIALAGNPNCGKTALFNALTGGKQKVANYPGVTVERKEGPLKTPDGEILTLIDLPGTYSLDSRTLDEEITRDVIFGTQPDQACPHLLIAVADATNLERNLGLILELKKTGRPMILALNMMDLARDRGLEIDIETLSRGLGMPVIPTVAPQREGVSELIAKASEILKGLDGDPSRVSPGPHGLKEIRDRFTEVDSLLKRAISKPVSRSSWTDRIDRVVLHPLWGSLFLVLMLLVVFQAIFNWATVPQDWIRAGLDGVSGWLRIQMPDGPLRSLMIEGALAGFGSVVVFLPQILFLFFFILMLEDSGYMARAAFLMDRLMGGVGLHGRAFIPLLSSFACAIPGIMATRTIENRRDRLITILVAPLMTCSARLPVYSLLIAAFIPNRVVFLGLKLQGLVMLALYFFGIFASLVMAYVFKKYMLKGSKPPLLMELPTYKWPNPRDVILGLVERAQLFIQRAGRVILMLSILLWFLASYPKPPTQSTESAIYYSLAGKIGRTLEPVFRPIGFNWQISVALIPGFAAREVMIGALATVYAVESKNNSRQVLSEVLSKNWSLATALSLLVWYILACQCLSTLAVTRRETNSWLWPGVMLGYMTVLAYAGSFGIYRFAVAMGWG